MVSVREYVAAYDSGYVVLDWNRNHVDRHALDRTVVPADQ